MKIYVDPVGYVTLAQSEEEIPTPCTELGGADGYALYRGSDRRLYAVEMPGMPLFKRNEPEAIP